MDRSVDPAWRQWVRWCVRLGAWLVAMSLFWLLLLVVALVREGIDERGPGPLALVALLAFADIAVLGNLGRWWLRPRWPGSRRPPGWWPDLIDPLGWQLRAVTAAVLAFNLLLSFADQMGALDWVSAVLSLAALGLLAVVVRTSPARGPRAGASA